MKPKKGEEIYGRVEFAEGMKIEEERKNKEKKKKEHRFSGN